MSKRKKLLLSSIMCSLILGVSAAPVSAELLKRSIWMRWLLKAPVTTKLLCPVALTTIPPE